MMSMIIILFSISKDSIKKFDYYYFWLSCRKKRKNTRSFFLSFYLVWLEILDFCIQLFLLFLILFLRIYIYTLYMYTSKRKVPARAIRLRSTIFSATRPRVNTKFNRNFVVDEENASRRQPTRSFSRFSCIILRVYVFVRAVLFH